MINTPDNEQAASSGESEEPKKRKRRRFESAKQLENEIDKVRSHANMLMLEAEIMDKFADVMRSYPDFRTTKDVSAVDEYRGAAVAKRLYAKRREASIAKLSRALAEIRTMPLLTVSVKPDGEADDSVQLQ